MDQLSGIWKIVTEEVKKNRSRAQSPNENRSRDEGSRRPAAGDQPRGRTSTTNQGSSPSWDDTPSWERSSRTTGGGGGGGRSQGDKPAYDRAARALFNLLKKELMKERTASRGGRENLSRSAPEETEYKKGYEKLRKFVSVFLQEINKEEGDLPPGARSRSSPRGRGNMFRSESEEDLPSRSRSRDAPSSNRQEEAQRDRDQTSRSSQRGRSENDAGDRKRKKYTLRTVIDALLDAADRV